MASMTSAPAKKLTPEEVGLATLKLAQANHALGMKVDATTTPLPGRTNEGSARVAETTAFRGWRRRTPCISTTPDWSSRRQRAQAW